MRPGFLGTWLEFLIHEPPEIDEDESLIDDWLLKKLQHRDLPPKYLSQF